MTALDPRRRAFAASIGKLVADLVWAEITTPKQSDAHACESQGAALCNGETGAERNDRAAARHP